MYLPPEGVSCLVMETPAAYPHSRPNADQGIGDSQQDADRDHDKEGGYYAARRDLLWKAIIEDLFDDFLRFFFPDTAARLDLDRGVEYLDKEMAQLFPPENDQFEPRLVDKLVKVFTRDGKGDCRAY